MRFFRGLLLPVLLLWSFLGAVGQHKKSVLIPVASGKSVWVDSVYKALSVDERIGQLFMVAAYSGGKNFNEELVTNLINAHQIGGLIFMQGGPVRQAMLTNKYQHLAQVPLLIGMDAEWGLGMRLDSVRSYPRQMMLGATHDPLLVYNMGSAIAAQCKRLQVHIDFAPDVDVNNNPANPVINSRSFGEDKTYVAKLGIAYMQGLQQNGVIACAKHFPGHGDTNVDSHKDLPLISKSKEELDTLELYPFRRLIESGVKSIMVAHLEVPALDTTPHVPTTLSKNAVTGLLKNQMGYNGLIITDALGMQGVTKYFPAGEADLRAFVAGNDILLFSQDVPIALKKIKTALDSGAISQERLEASVKKILAAKYDMGLPKRKDIDTAHITEDLNRLVDSTRIKVAKEAITLVRDDNNILKKINENMHVGYVGINASGTTPLYESLNNVFDNVKADWLPKGSTPEKADEILKKIADNDATIVAVHGLNFYPSNFYGLSEEALYFLLQIEHRKNVMLVLLGNAYALQTCYTVPSALISYEDDSLTEKVVASVLLKKIKATGTLPVTPVATVCINTNPVKPLEKKETTYDLHQVMLPTDAGVKEPAVLDKLDMFIQRCIADGVFPGCRILAAKNGKVFYDKPFGYLKYDKLQHVDTNTLYDMASCTKILATTLSVMRLYEEGKLDLDKTLVDYLPQAANTNKANLKIRDILLHQAGLKSFIPFYKATVDEEGKPLKKYFKSKEKDRGGFDVPIAKNLYMRRNYIDTIWNKIYASEVDNSGKSVYSDLDYYFLWKIVEKLTGQPLDQYANEQFYKPLGLSHILYNPLSRFDTLKIAPTEWDVYFRQELVYGYVHDPGAAMMGGVAGHAGLFATANDVAVIFQMLMNKGIYGGKRIFKPATLDLFTGYRSPRNHRGLGFDKPATDADDGGPAGTRCSALTFGHTGFTGTCAWADPATGILFVFLSNRVYPSATNTKITKLNVRTVAQDYIYESLGLQVVHDRQVVYDKQVKEGN